MKFAKIIKKKKIKIINLKKNKIKKMINKTININKIKLVIIIFKLMLKIIKLMINKLKKKIKIMKKRIKVTYLFS